MESNITFTDIIAAIAIHQTGKKRDNICMPNVNTSCSFSYCKGLNTGRVLLSFKFFKPEHCYYHSHWSCSSWIQIEDPFHQTWCCHRASNSPHKGSCLGTRA